MQNKIVTRGKIPSFINNKFSLNEDNAIVALARDGENYFLLVEYQSDTSRRAYGCYKLQIDPTGKGVDKIIINTSDCAEALAAKTFNNEVLQGKQLLGKSWSISRHMIDSLEAEIQGLNQFPENMPPLLKENPGFSWWCSVLPKLKVPNIIDTLPKNPEELNESISAGSHAEVPEVGTEQPTSSGHYSLM